jgi:hypothetical protein
MNFNKTIFFSWLFSFTNLVNAAPPVASITFSDPIVSNNIVHYTVTDPNNEPYTIQTTKGGLDCRLIPDKKYGYFRADDATFPSTENNLIFTITFFDEGTGTFSFQYNANDATNYKSSTITKTGTNTWITLTLAVTNASFRNAQNNASDFRISSGGGTYIREITIAKGILNPETEPVPMVSASSYSEFTGKSVAGYQAWFKTGSSTSGWFHWSGTTPPSQYTTHFEVYPDVSEYLDADLTATALANLGNTQPSKLFNSANKSVIDTHFKWMKDYGIDGVAVQRFIGNIGNAIVKSPANAAIKIKESAEANQRIFYICYDTSSSGMEATWDDTIKFDWVYNVEQNDLTKSDAYAKVGNKPVVQLWGTGMAGGKNPGTAAETIALIQFLQSRGCYVIGGTPRSWRTGTRDSKGTAQTSTIPGDQENFEPVYQSYDMISPWMVGRIKNNTEADAMLTGTMIPDKTYLDARNIDYMPVIFPGFAWSQWNEGTVNWAPRNAGDFMWKQAINIKSLGVSSMYFAMFDEYDEGTAIMKNATDWSMIPTDQYFLTSSADGIWLSSDFQLRVAGASIEMLKGTRAVTTTVPVPHSLGPIYFRNSFEQRTTPYNYVNDIAQNTGTFNLDPSFYKPALIENTNTISPTTAIQQTNVKSGLYSVKVSGSVAISSNAVYRYKTSEVEIPITTNMKLSFWKKTENELGKYVFVDLITASGKKVSTEGYKDQNGNSMKASTAHGTVGAGWEKFTCNLGDGPLLGDTIVGITLNYETTGTGAFEAYFDDFLIEEGQALDIKDNSESIVTKIAVYPNPSTGLFNFENLSNKEVQITIYSINGELIKNSKSDATNVSLDLSNKPNGIYLLNIKDGDNNYTQKLIKN